MNAAKWVEQIVSNIVKDAHIVINSKEDVANLIRMQMSNLPSDKEFNSKDMMQKHIPEVIKKLAEDKIGNSTIEVIVEADKPKKYSEKGITKYFITTQKKRILN
jgi:hypothetical protein